MPNKLIKHMAIARSGVYMYNREELPSLGIAAIPEEYDNYVVFGVYRPATVLAKRANLFSRLPVTVEHPNYMLNPANVDLYMKGYTGEEVSTVIDPQSEELLIISSMTLVAQEAIDAYDNEVREVSPGYTPIVVWSKGIHHEEDYQLMVSDITDVNHLAITRRARGGTATRIFDSEGGNSMKDTKFFSGLWRFLHKKAAGTKDTDVSATRRILAEIAEKKEAMSNEEIATKVAEVQTLAADLPESDGKSKLVRFLEDFKQSKQMDSPSVTEASEMIATLFESLDASAMADVVAPVADVVAPVAEVVTPAAAAIIEAAATVVPEVIPEVIPEVATVDSPVGSTTLTNPAQYVPGTKEVGEDSGEDLSSQIKGLLKGRKLSASEAISLLQSLLSEGSEDSAPKVEPEEKKPEEKKPEDKKEPEDKGTKDSITATFETETVGDNKTLDAFMHEHFGITRR